MKVKWIVKLRNGATRTVESDVDELPTPGDGKVIDGAWGVVSDVIVGGSGDATVLIADNSIHAFRPETWDEEAKFYFNFVKDVMNEGRNVPFSNGRPLHAVYLIREFFLNAKDDMRIFSGSLARYSDRDDDGPDSHMALYADPHVTDAIKKFLRKDGAKLKVVVDKLDVDDGQMETHPLIHAVKSLKASGELKGSCELREIDPGVAEYLRTQNYNYHMMLMDKSAYRVETDPDNFKAYVNVNDAEMTGSLIDFFDEVTYGRSHFLWKESADLAAS